MTKNYDFLVEQILKNVGGSENIANVMHCYTRLRVNYKDESLVNPKNIEEISGVLGIQKSGQQIQIVIGNEVKEVYEAFIKVSGLQREDAVDERIESDFIGKKLSVKGVFNSIIDGVVGCVVPLIPMLIASGLIKAFVLILQQFGWVAADSPTVVVLSFVADAAFYFLPVIIGTFAAKKFGANVALGGMLGAALIHPSFIEAVGAGIPLNVFGFPVYATGYSSTVIPIILSVLVMSYIEKYLNKVTPKSIRTVVVPFVTILIMTPLMFGALAPLGAMLSQGFANLLNWLYGTFGFITVAVFTALIPWLVMLGMHLGTIPIAFQSLASTGIDKLILPAFFLANFTQGAACLAVGVKTKSAETKSLAFSSAFSNIVPGISEPGMYGITLRYKTPMWGAMIGAAAGGLYFGLTNVGILTFMPPNLFALAGFVGTGAASNNLMNAVIGVVIGMVIAFAATMILYKPEQK